jgi:hypothetical protein
MPSYPPILVRVTLQINLPHFYEGEYEKKYMQSYPPI